MATAETPSIAVKEPRMTATDKAVEKQEEVSRIAKTLYADTPDWVTFYREILGLKGIVRQMFPTLHSLTEFKQLEAYREIQHMLRRLRERGPMPVNDDRKNCVITVRLPESLHEALREEAHEHRTSMNKLCVSKLLQFIDNNMVPPQ
jgi:predicted HicB family RNase H-like nuclease